MAIEVCCSQIKALHIRWCQRVLDARAQCHDAQLVSRCVETVTLLRSDAEVLPDVDPLSVALFNMLRSETADRSSVRGVQSRVELGAFGRRVRARRYREQ